MGSCISKCKPKKLNSIEDQFNYVVQDKLVISQPKINPISSSNKISPSPPSPTISSSSSSASSFTCTNTSSSTISSCSSLSSSKDRMFSNEFLRSCIKENPHVIRINSIKECSELLVPQNVHAKKRVLNGSTGQKRVRSNSPNTLTRQKSFRRDSERFYSNPYNSLPNRTLRSPSPSRRFIGDNAGIMSAIAPKETGNSRRIVGCSKVNRSVVSSAVGKENVRAALSRYIHGSHHHLLVNQPCLMMRKKETCIHRVGSDMVDIGEKEEAAGQQDSECIPMEDVDNPLISLDCFIFL